MDLNPASYEPCSKYGKIYIGKVEDAKYPDEYFDVIFSSSLFYYLTNPLAHLLEIKRILKKDGLIVIKGIPNLKSLDSKISFKNIINPYPPNQVSFYFDKSHFKKLVVKSGLKVKLIQSKGFGVSIKIWEKSWADGKKLDSSKVTSGKNPLIPGKKNLFIRMVKPFINFLLNTFNLGYHFNAYLIK